MAVTFLTNEDEKKYVKTINDTAPDENGNIVVKGEGIAYDNTVSGIDATTVQGAIDKLSGGNVDQEQITIAINTALAQAKESGEFDGITPEFTIGTVETLDAGSNATASINGTKENPVLNLGIPQGLPGEGGTGGAQWRLCYVKLTDDVSSVTITEDIDGNPIEATEIQCYLISDFLHQNGSSVNGTIQMEINGVYIGEQFAGVLATGKPYSNIYYDAVTGEMRWVRAGLENGDGAVNGRTKAFPSETPIRSITFSWMHHDWLLKSGSEIKCWVR